MKKTCKLFIADIDGTLRWVGNPGPITISALKQLHESGVLVGVASGRPFWQKLVQHAEDWGLGFQFDVIIGMNGGQLWDTRKNIRQDFNLLSCDTIHEIYDKMAPLGENASVYREEGYTLALRIDEMMKDSMRRNHDPVYVVKDPSELWAVPNHKIMFRCPTVQEAAKADQFAQSISCDRYRGFRTSPPMVEFQDPRNNKGNALKEYCKANQIDLSDVIAFGDSENDIEMLKCAGTSVCLQNGLQHVKDICTAVTEYTVDEDGAGRYLYDHIL